MAAAETAALDMLQGPARLCPRGHVLRRERAGTDQMWVLEEGWAFSCLSLRDGGRQITEIHLPGDILGLPGMAATQAAQAVVALTEISVRPVTKVDIGGLFVTHPRLAALTFQFTQQERVALGDRLAAIGRVPALGRVAGLLLDLLYRCRRIDASVRDTLVLPMTQEELGDTIGLTAVHVNRMMRLLVDKGLIARGAGTVRILDEPHLLRLSGHADRRDAIDTGWLPPPQD